MKQLLNGLFRLLPKYCHKRTYGVYGSNNAKNQSLKSQCDA